MSSLKRMLAVFDVFTPDDPSLTADEIMARLNYSRGTAYRYIRELTSAGFLKRIGGSYSFGPRIVELDYFIRENDPNLRIVQPILHALSERLECDVLWANFFGDHVVVSHHERGAAAQVVSYGRGRRMPLFRGAPSKVILSMLPPARLKRIYEASVEDIRLSSLGGSWVDFKKRVTAIRRAGYFVSISELDAGSIGIAAPVRADSSSPPGSICLVFSAKRFAIADENLLAQIAKDTASQISAIIAGGDVQTIIMPAVRSKLKVS